MSLLSIEKETRIQLTATVQAIQLHAVSIKQYEAKILKLSEYQKKEVLRINQIRYLRNLKPIK